jgi:hypothetical protein
MLKIQKLAAIDLRAQRRISGVLGRKRFWDRNEQQHCDPDEERHPDETIGVPVERQMTRAGQTLASKTVLRLALTGLSTQSAPSSWLLGWNDTSGCRSQKAVAGQLFFLSRC